MKSSGQDYRRKSLAYWKSSTPRRGGDGPTLQTLSRLRLPRLEAYAHVALVDRARPRLRLPLLGGEDLGLLDGRGAREELLGAGEQRLGDVAGQMGIPAVLVGEGVEDAEL